MKKLIKTKKGKLILLGIAAGLLIAALILAVALHRSGYRTIQVYRLDGDAEISRPVVGRLTPYVNMMLQNGDRARTMEDGWLYMLLDGEDYLLAEPRTTFTLHATGTRSERRTNLDLEIGALVNILRPLGENSVYEVTTPNSVMAVRGTSFRVEVWFDGEGVSHTLLQVFEGVVEVHLLYPDGKPDEHPRRFTAGQAAQIWGDDITSDYEDGVSDIDYYSLKIPTLEFLKIGLDDDDGEYAITEEELDEIIRIKQTYFDVIFMVDGNVFGTQSILFDGHATEPLLKPSLRGEWDFDFDTAIREETTINWIWK